MDFGIGRFGAWLVVLALLPVGCKQIAGYQQAQAPVQPPDAGVMDAWQPNDGAVDAVSVPEVSVPPREDAAGDGPLVPTEAGFPGEAGVLADGDLPPAIDVQPPADLFQPADALVVPQCLKDIHCMVLQCCDATSSCNAVPTDPPRTCLGGSQCATACTSLGLVWPEAYCHSNKCRLRDGAGCMGGSDCVTVNTCCLRCTVVTKAVYDSLPTCMQTCNLLPCLFSAVCSNMKCSLQ